MASQMSRLFAILTVFFMTASFLMVGQASAEHTWTEEVLDHAEAAGFASSIRIDSSNNPVISYGSIFGLNYTAKSGGTWTTEQVFENMTFDNDLKMDSSGNPHIACIIGDYFTEDIKYASKSGSAWTNVTILSNVKTEGYISLSLSENNNPYILCQLTDSGLVKKTLTLFYESSGSWVQENITLYGGWESYDMAIGGGNIHVVFENASAYTIQYATRPISGGSWQFEKLMDGGITDGAVSLDVDSSGNPHILIGFQHMWKNGNTWLSEPLNMIYSGMDYLDLYIDSSDNLHAAIHVSYSLIYGQKTSSTWEFEAVGTDNEGLLCSVIADSTGIPHISHYNVNHDNLKYHAGTPTSVNPDSDSDGLPDAWENTHFGGLDQGATDDPDADGHDNLDEYTNGTDPMDASDPIPATNPDSDGDGLPDTWENTHFGDLDEVAAGDPDDDGTNNLAEYNGDTDPNDPTDPSLPQINTDDTDNDGLPDTWENTHFGNLNQGATDDPDNDLFNNLAEYGAGTDPNDPESTPLDFGFDWFSDLILWVLAIVLIVIVVIVVIIFVVLKAANDPDVPISSHQPPAHYPPQQQTYQQTPPVVSPPPPPTPAQAQQSPATFCPTCGQQATFVHQYGKNYCNNCGKYL